MPRPTSFLLALILATLGASALQAQRPINLLREGAVSVAGGVGDSESMMRHANDVITRYSSK